MNDKELLEWSARAAGYKFIRWLPVSEFFEVTEDDGTVTYFNPLEDDGDALRLAIKLKIDLEFYHENPIEGESIAAYKSPSIHSIYCRENTALNSDLGAATRRAIVRAAAEIGRSL